LIFAQGFSPGNSQRVKTRPAERKFCRPTGVSALHPPSTQVLGYCQKLEWRATGYARLIHPLRVGVTRALKAKPTAASGGGHGLTAVPVLFASSPRDFMLK